MAKEGITKSFDLGDGREITIETGRLATQADGSVIVKMGDTMLLATVVSNKEAKEGMNFMPLTVDYREKYAAAGRIPGGFFKRESRPSEYEILISRLIDRALRPLFPKKYYFETQVLISLISADEEILPDALAALAASSALMVSDVPFSGPISEVRVGRINGELKINPERSELPDADIDIIVAASEDNIMMVEGEMKEVPEADLIEAIKAGHAAIKVQCRVQKELQEMAGKEKREAPEIAEDEDLKKEVEKYRSKIEDIVKASLSKPERREKFSEIKNEIVESLGEEPEEEKIAMAKNYYSELEKEVIRNYVLDKGIRLDGRKTNEIRPLWMEVDYLPAAHGSAIFTRGETQSLTTVTFGTKIDEQIIDEATFQTYSKFLLHYNFPPFCTGEAKPMRGTSRREVGHGNLAMRSLKPVLPSEEDNPYTIRIVSDILESNGSSSMATVCAGSLALMDAGVKTKSHVSGIAMGLISDGERNAVLSDILGDEDHLGDMDFKVTGTINGICACQMDIKIEGLSNELLTKALDQAKEGRLYILEAMNKVLDSPRSEYKPHVPRLEKIFIDKEFIGMVIGPGGKHIQELQADTNTEVVIEEEDEHGVVTIAGRSEDIERAADRVRGMTQKPEKDKVYEGKVKTIMPYGAFVEFLPGKEGLLHISEISWKRLESMDDVLTEGDTVKVQLIDIDEKRGKYSLSRKVLLPKPDFSKKES